MLTDTFVLLVRIIRCFVQYRNIERNIEIRNTIYVDLLLDEGL